MEILLIEDNEDHIELFFDLVAEIRAEFNVSCERSLGAGLARLEEATHDIVLCDLSLPDSSISNTVMCLSENKFELPIVALTSLQDSNVAKELLSHGIQDFIPKEKLTPELIQKCCLFAVERFKHQHAIEVMNKDMEAFCASLSHDFNSSISRIMSISKVIKQEVSQQIDVEEELATWFDYLDISATRIHTLVTDLEHYLSVATTEEDSVEVELDALIKSLADDFREATGQSFDLFFLNKLHSVMGIKSLIYILLQNLLSNAIKFSGASPRIEIGTEMQDGWLRLTIADNGVGFDEDQAKLIFTPFTRLAKTKEKQGSGLGLSIVKRIADIHDGKIEVTSKMGQGSKFVILFPC